MKIGSAILRTSENVTDETVNDVTASAHSQLRLWS